MTEAGWHLAGTDLGRYVDRTLPPAARWSVEAHLAGCAGCRRRLATTMDPLRLRAGWARLDAALDAPVPGPVERLLVRAGVADHTARLLVATPALRVSWLLAVATTLVLTAVVARLAQPLVFHALVPLLPLVGVAVSFGPRVDPTYEISLVAPAHTFRVLLLRTASVLATTTGLSALACLALPDLGLRALGWFLPALALTLFSLTLTPRLGPMLAPAVVGTGWLALVVATAGIGAGSGAGATAGQAVVLGLAGQAGLALAGLAAGLLLVRLRPAFETPRDSIRSSLFPIRRMP